MILRRIQAKLSPDQPKYDGLLGTFCYHARHSTGLQDTPPDDKEKFVRARILEKEDSMLESVYLHTSCLMNRKISHELVRHRIATYCQESTRWCNYTKGRFEGSLSFVFPEWLWPLDEYGSQQFNVELDPNQGYTGGHVSLSTLLDFKMKITRISVPPECPPSLSYWLHRAMDFENIYMESNRYARDLNLRATDFMGEFLPNCLATWVSIVKNVRSWRNYFFTRLVPEKPEKVFPGHRLLAYRCWEILSKEYPVFF